MSAKETGSILKLEILFFKCLVNQTEIINAKIYDARLVFEIFFVRWCSQLRIQKCLNEVQVQVQAITTSSCLRRNDGNIKKLN